MIHLHAHSFYSFLDGTSSPTTLAERAVALGQSALALTDWNGVYGAVEHDRACHAVGIRPIFGAEIALTDGRHLTLLVRDREGWRSLCRLLSAAQLEGSKGHAPVRPALLEGNAAGLTCLTGCRRGALAAPILGDDEDAAWRAARWLRDVFGDRLWVELPRNRHADDRLLARRLAGLAGNLGLGIVASANVHYAMPREAALADVLACVRAGTTLERARHLRGNDAYHLASRAEMIERYVDLPEAIANTHRVADGCQFTLDLGPHRFPGVALPDGRTPDAHLRALCRTGLTERYGGGEPGHWRRAAAQLDHELAIVRRHELAPYFLLVHDVAAFARRRGIPCQGRGSAAGSVIAFSLGISRVDPLEHRLLFERFLSPERRTLPDIDIDLASRTTEDREGREVVIQYLYRRWGHARVAMACTFQRFHTRGAVRDVGKVLGLPTPTLKVLGKRVEQGLDDDLTAAVVAVAGPAALDDPTWAALVALCGAIRGIPRHTSIHNGGTIVTAGPIGELIPVERATMPDRTVVQFDKDSLELAGVIKLDLLGLEALDLVREAVALVEETEGRRLDLDRLPLDDAATFDLLCAARTIGTFQTESRAQQQSLPQHRPRTFTDLVCQISIIRPGPLQSGMVHPFLRRRAGEEPVAFPHPSLEPVLRDSCGIFLWQEQILEAATILAGFSAGQGDDLRRALASARGEEPMAALRERFVTGAVNQGVDEQIADEVFRQIKSFAAYGFPRSHASAFARTTYETAYLKVHHPVAFYCGRLRAQPGGFYPPATVVGDARRNGIRILGPDLGRSGFECTIEDGGVRIGLRYVRQLDGERGRAVVAERGRGGLYRDLDDLCRRARHHLTPEAVAALIAGGACDGWGRARRQLLWALPSAWRSATGFPLSSPPIRLAAETALERINAEIWATGLPLSGHPAMTQRSALAARGVLPVTALAASPAGRWLTLAGQLVIRQAPETAKGVVFVMLEDETALGDLVFAPEAYRRCRAALHAAPLFLATGRVQRRGIVTNLLVTEVEPWWPSEGEQRL